MGTTTDKLNKLLNTKAAIKAAIVGKGQAVSDSDTFASYANKISAIKTGVDTSDATAAAGDILAGKTAYAKGSKVTGTYSPAITLVKHGYTFDQYAKFTQAISAGKYLVVVHHNCGNFNYTGYTDEGYISTLVFQTDGSSTVTTESQYYGVAQYYTSGGSAKTQTADSTATTEISASMSSGTLTASWSSNGGYNMHWYGSVYLLYKVG